MDNNLCAFQNIGDFVTVLLNKKFFKSLLCEDQLFQVIEEKDPRMLAIYQLYQYKKDKQEYIENVELLVNYVYKSKPFH